MKMKAIIGAVLAMSILAPVALALRMRKIPLRESVCQSDIVVLGVLHEVEKSAFTVVMSTRLGTSYPYDRGQISRQAPKEMRFLKDDPWRTTSSVVDVVLRSRWMGDLTDYFSDSGEWIWLLRREGILGSYFVLKRLPLTDEELVFKTLKEGCGKA